MKTGTPTDRRPLPLERLTAANDEAAFETPHVPVAQAAVAGWDPYEVWRTRVKAPQDRSSEPRTRA